MPRRYRMGARAAAANDTAERIVHAARELHARQGISGTSYEEIAAEASTSTATVYRHFPSLAELLPACARSVVVLKEITREDALLLFRGLDTPTERLDLLISGTCECYQRDGDWLNAARGEDRTYAVLAELARIQTSSLRLLVEAALEWPCNPSSRQPENRCSARFPGVEGVDSRRLQRNRGDGRSPSVDSRPTTRIRRMRYRRRQELSKSDRAYVLDDGDGEALRFAGALMTLKASGDQTEGRFALIDQTAPPDYAAPLHVHQDEDEAWYVLEGEAEFFCGERRFTAAAGAWVFLPKAVPHSFRVGADGARLLTLTAPSRFADFVREAGEPASQESGAPMDVAALAAIASRYGIEIVGPPPA